jgi:hypothetical protein
MNRYHSLAFRLFGILTLTGHVSPVSFLPVRLRRSGRRRAGGHAGRPIFRSAARSALFRGGGLTDQFPTLNQGRLPALQSVADHRCRW